MSVNECGGALVSPTEVRGVVAEDLGQLPPLDHTVGDELGGAPEHAHAVAGGPVRGVLVVGAGRDVGEVERAGRLGARDARHPRVGPRLGLCPVGGAVEVGVRCGGVRALGGLSAVVDLVEVGVGVPGVRPAGDLRHVVDAVVVGVGVVGVGAGSGPVATVGADLEAVAQAVVVAVGIGRVGRVAGCGHADEAPWPRVARTGRLLRVAQPVTVGVGGVVEVAGHRARLVGDGPVVGRHRAVGIGHLGLGRCPRREEGEARCQQRDHDHDLRNGPLHDVPTLYDDRRRSRQASAP